MSYDVMIIGGSYAGLSAAMQLARARRTVLVIDAGERRNRFADHSHGFLTQDGADPAEIQRIGRAQLMKYPTVTWREDRVAAAEPGAPFTVTLASGDRVTAARIVLAVGMIDDLPDLPGASERWGKSIFACPYCHGYELGGGPIGVIATHPLSHHSAMMLPDWGPTTFFTQGTFDPDAEIAANLARRGVTIERAPITRIANHADVELADGRSLAFAGLFMISRPRIPAIATQLGLVFEQGAVNAFIQTDQLKETSTPGVYACGDVALPMPSVALAVADGARAGVAAHQSLIFRP